ncbi:MAG: hypothetical protein ACTSPB_17660 [Candidatus Thorarchaeota archaeon]
MTTKSVIVKQIAGEHLALRLLANNLFDYIELLKNTNIILDFSGVHTTSRSFMQQFSYRAENSDIHIIYTNESEIIRKMRHIASSPKKKPMIANLNPENLANLDPNEL